MKQRPWTAEDDALLTRLYPTTRTDQVAAALGRSMSSLYVRACHLDVRKADGCYGRGATLQPEEGDRAAT